MDLMALNQAFYLRSLAEEKDFWKQKSQIKWLSDSDRNTKFYHALLKIRQARLSVNRIKNDQGVYEDNIDNIKSLVEFFLAPCLRLSLSHKVWRLCSIF